MLELDDIFGSAPTPTASTITECDSPLDTDPAVLFPEDADDILGEMFGTAPVDKPAVAMLIECPPPGVYYDIPAHVYHSWAAVSSTLLKGYAELPSTARIPYDPKDDANVGSGLHAYCLQGQAGLDAECHFGPKFGKSEADKKARAALQAEHPSKTVLPAFYGSPAPGEPIMDILQGVDKSLQAHLKIGPVLRGSRKEVSLVWIDEDSACLCKARLDIWEAAEQTIWDLKKCRSISGFQWQIKDLFYGVQAGHYFNGAIACGLPAVAFGFIPCEAFPPYQVACGYVDPEKLDRERVNARRIIGLVKQSQLTGNWPNFPIPDHIFNLNDITPDDLVQVY
jgi:hypothetical protein